MFNNNKQDYGVGSDSFLRGSPELTGARKRDESHPAGWDLGYVYEISLASRPSDPTREGLTQAGEMAKPMRKEMPGRTLTTEGEVWTPAFQPPVMSVLSFSLPSPPS